MEGMEPLPIVLPADASPPRRQPLPLLASVIPVAAGVVLWWVTGSLLALCFAAVGPMMLAASAVDQARTRRRETRRLDAEAHAAWERAEREVIEVHDVERRRRQEARPDVLSCIEREPLPAASEPDAATSVVVGRGDIPSAVRTTGGGDGERARAFQERSRVLRNAPIEVPLGRGVCVRGPAPLTAAVTRALVLQLCLRYDATRLAVVAKGDQKAVLAALPHTSGTAGAFRLGVGTVPDHPKDADAWVLALRADEDVPPGFATVLEVREAGDATLRRPDGDRRVRPEGVSEQQFRLIAGARLRRAADHAEALPARVELAELATAAEGDGLPATIGRGIGEETVVDLVDDGPHAIVTGTTGTGKSELLISWVAALASSAPPDRVIFVLVDFKGGTAFEPLRPLPHVAAIVTDLDARGARRGVQSLTAELRRRESALAAAGVRDVRETTLPRLVIVVDEFAALVGEHPDLAAIFTDVAARGRALGMHLILGTQRASGVIRDALAANCPLRLSLRVSDPADSRAVLGTTAAAELPGGSSAQGLCLVRRPDDAAPVATRVALSRASDIDRIARRWADHPVRAASPWLPPLPSDLSLSELRQRVPEDSHGALWGLADAPDTQSQLPVSLDVGRERGAGVIGAAGTGRTTALRALAVHRADAVWMPSDPEESWDLVSALAAGEEPLPPLLLVDDLDARFAELSAEYAQQLAQRWEQIVRAASGTTIVMTAMRASGPAGRLLDMLPRRVLLRAGSRMEHIAAGGASDAWDESRPPGRGVIDGREMQIVRVDAPSGEAERRAAGTTDDAAVREWRPEMPMSALVTAGANDAARSLEHAHPHADVWTLGGPEGAERARALAGQSGGRPQIIVGEGDAWQREWALWQRVRAEGEVLVRVERPVELRQLAGVRELPPYARSHAGRVWVVRGDRAPVRRVIPTLVRSGAPAVLRAASAAPSTRRRLRQNAAG